MKHKLFIATSSFKVSKDIILKCKRLDLIIKKNPLKKKLNNAQLIEFAKDASFIIAGTEEYTNLTFRKLKKLKMIFRLGSGTDNIDLKIAKEFKVKILKSKITPEVAVSEIIVSNIINILRKIYLQDQNLKNNIWKKEMGHTLKDKTVGIVGFGKIGRYLYKLLKNFGVKILINDIKKIKNKKNTSLDNLLKNSDIVSLNLNLNNMNNQLINKQKLNLLKKESILVNCSRPELLDYKFLLKILKKRKIKDAILDVYPNEHYTGEFQKLKNVILTPHIGSYAFEVRNLMEQESLSKILNSL